MMTLLPPPRPATIIPSLEWETGAGGKTPSPIVETGPDEPQTPDPFHPRPLGLTFPGGTPGEHSDEPQTMT